MIILGIDPGLAACGWGGIIEEGGLSLGLLGSGVVRTKAGIPEAERVAAVEDRIAHVVGVYRPNVVAIEAYVQRWSSGRASARSHIEVARVIGALCSRMRQLGVPVAEYPAAEWMRAIVGPRRLVLSAGMAVALRLELREVPPEHEADAIGVAIYHASQQRMLAPYPRVRATATTR